MDAAEELFAQHGIDAVSSRKIAEKAGNANHSAIAYHFGTREEFIAALLRRGNDRMAARRAELEAKLDDDSTVREALATRFVPWIEMLAELSQPSWRARFIFQARLVPSVAPHVDGISLEHPPFDSLVTAGPWRELKDIPRTVLRARAGILGNLMLGVCSDYEGRMQAGSVDGDWNQVGNFLLDAAAGMLTAPVTPTEKPS